MPRGRPKANVSLEGAEAKPIENNEIVSPASAVSIDVDSVAKMNDLARRIWEGQSTSLPLGERVARIRMRLKEKGYKDMDSIKLPDDGYSKGYEKFL